MNLFMMAEHPQPENLHQAASGYHIRNIRPDEIDLWKKLQCENNAEDPSYISEYFELVYKPDITAFFSRFFAACDQNDEPVGFCGIWKAYDRFESIHWLRVREQNRSLGLGSALLRACLERAETKPVWLHTQPESRAAIRLYTACGFVFLCDEQIGHRINHFNSLRSKLSELIGACPESFLSDGALHSAALQCPYSQF